jgi:LysR family transcriptional activator of nhaA
MNIFDIMHRNNESIAGAREWLNYHHLVYFHAVVREGGVRRAAEKLFLTQPTISKQIHALEQSLGEKLLARRGRKLELTGPGRIVYRYADEIVALGGELQVSLKRKSSSFHPWLRVGISDVIPKLVAFRLLKPLTRRFPKMRLHCGVQNSEALFVQLAAHRYDVVITDTPLPPGSRVRAYSHLLGHSGFTFLAASAVAAALRGNFPASLDGRPILMPTESAARRRNLEGWFGQIGVGPFLAGEFEDISLLRMFASDGMGIMPAATWVEKDVRRHFDLKVIGATDAVRESFYAISPERRITHPAVALLCAEGQKSLRNNGKSP